MASGFKINGVDLDDIFRSDGTTRLTDAETEFENFLDENGFKLNDKYLKSGPTDPDPDLSNSFPYKAAGISASQSFQNFKNGQSAADPLDELREDPQQYVLATIREVNGGLDVEGEVEDSGLNTPVFNMLISENLCQGHYQFYDGSSWIDIGAPVALDGSNKLAPITRIDTRTHASTGSETGSWAYRFKITFTANDYLNAGTLETPLANIAKADQAQSFNIADNRGTATPWFLISDIQQDHEVYGLMPFITYQKADVQPSVGTTWTDIEGILPGNDYVKDASTWSIATGPVLGDILAKETPPTPIFVGSSELPDWMTEFTWTTDPITGYFSLGGGSDFDIDYQYRTPDSDRLTAVTSGWVDWTADNLVYPGAWGKVGTWYTNTNPLGEKGERAREVRARIIPVSANALLDYDNGAYAVEESLLVQKNDLPVIDGIQVTPIPWGLTALADILYDAGDSDYEDQHSNFRIRFDESFDEIVSDGTSDQTIVNKGGIALPGEPTGEATKTTDYTSEAIGQRGLQTKSFRAKVVAFSPNALADYISEEPSYSSYDSDTTLKKDLTVLSPVIASTPTVWETGYEQYEYNNVPGEYTASLMTLRITASPPVGEAAIPDRSLVATGTSVILTAIQHLRTVPGLRGSDDTEYQAHLDLTGAADIDFNTPSPSILATSTPLKEDAPTLPVLVDNSDPWRVGLEEINYNLPVARDASSNWILTVSNNRGFSSQNEIGSAAIITISAFQETTLGFGAGSRAGINSTTQFSLSLGIIGNDLLDYNTVSPSILDSTASQKILPDPVLTGTPDVWQIDLITDLDLDSVSESSPDLGYGTEISFSYYYDRTDPVLANPTTLLETISVGVTEPVTDQYQQSHLIDTSLNPIGNRAGGIHKIRVIANPTGGDLATDFVASNYSADEEVTPIGASTLNAPGVTAETTVDAWSATFDITSVVPSGYLDSDFRHDVDSKWLGDRIEVDSSFVDTGVWDSLTLGAASTDVLWSTAGETGLERGERTQAIRVRLIPFSAAAQNDFEPSPWTGDDDSVILVSGKRRLSNIAGLATITAVAGEWVAEDIDANFLSPLADLGGVGSYVEADFNTIMVGNGTDRYTESDGFFVDRIISNADEVDAGNVNYLGLIPGSRTTNITVGLRVEPASANLDFDIGSIYAFEDSLVISPTKKAITSDPSIVGSPDTFFGWANFVIVSGDNTGNIDSSEYPSADWRVRLENREVSEDRLTSSDGAYTLLGDLTIQAGDIGGSYSTNYTVSTAAFTIGQRGDRLFQGRATLIPNSVEAVADWFPSNTIESARTEIECPKKPLDTQLTTLPDPTTLQLEWGTRFSAGFVDDPIEDWGVGSFEVVLGNRWGSLDPINGGTQPVDDNWQTLDLSAAGGLFTWTYDWDASLTESVGNRGGRYLDARYYIQPKSGTIGDDDFNGVTDWSNYVIGGETGKKQTPAPSSIFASTSEKWQITAAVSMTTAGINIVEYSNTAWEIEVERRFSGDRLLGTGSFGTLTSAVADVSFGLDAVLDFSSDTAGERGDRQADFRARVGPAAGNTDWEISDWGSTSNVGDALKAEYVTPSRLVTVDTGSEGWNYTVSYDAEAGEVGYTDGLLGIGSVEIATTGGGANSHSALGESLQTIVTTELKPSEYAAADRRYSRRIIPATGDYNELTSAWDVINDAPAKRDQVITAGTPVAANWGYTASSNSSDSGLPVTSTGFTYSTLNSFLKPSEYNSGSTASFTLSQAGDVDWNEVVGDTFTIGNTGSDFDIVPGKADGEMRVDANSAVTTIYGIQTHFSYQFRGNASNPSSGLFDILGSATTTLIGYANASDATGNQKVLNHLLFARSDGDPTNTSWQTLWSGTLNLDWGVSQTVAVILFDDLTEDFQGVGFDIKSVNVI